MTDLPSMNWMRLMSFGLMLQASESLDEAAEYFLAAIAVARKEYPDEPLKYALSLVSLGAVDVLSGNYQRAEAYLLTAWGIRKRHLPPCHHEMATVLHLLANAYHGQRRYEKANEFYTRTLSCFSHLPGTHPLKQQLLENIGSCLLETTRLNEGQQTA